MNQFGLIIEETTAGSNLQFVSAHLDINSFEIKETTTDERTLACQLANLSDVYSVQVTKNYKVYSLIVTNLTDFLGRSGYYAIRLYGPKAVNLTNFESILANIKEKYNNYTKSNTLNNQNYEDILSNILIVENDRKNFVAIKSSMNCFYYFDDANSTLSTVFNTKGVNLVNKIYAFNKNKAVNESIALTSGLKSFSQINASQKEINVINNYGVLNELKINDQLIDFNPNLTEFNVLCQTNDVLVYNAKDDKTYKTITNNFITIEKKFVPRTETKKSYSSSNQRKKKNNANAMYLIVGLMALVIGGGMFYFLNQDTPPIETQNTGTNDTITGHDEIVDAIAHEIIFEIDKKKYNGNIGYISNYPKLRDYIFSYGGGNWSYCYTKKSEQMVDFNETILNGFKLTPEEKKSFIENLQDISNQKILKESDTKEEAISQNVSKGRKSSTNIEAPKGKVNTESEKQAEAEKAEAAAFEKKKNDAFK